MKSDIMKPSAAGDGMRFLMVNATRQMIANELQQEHDYNGESHSWLSWIIHALLKTAAHPDEYTEDAAVNAARLIWEILRDEAKVH